MSTVERDKIDANNTNNNNQSAMAKNVRVYWETQGFSEKTSVYSTPPRKITPIDNIWSVHENLVKELSGDIHEKG